MGGHIHLTPFHPTGLPRPRFSAHLPSAVPAKLILDPLSKGEGVFQPVCCRDR